MATLAGIFRYPVKGMRGQVLERANLGWHGLAGDRRFAFLDGEDDRSGFPWLTGRKSPGMVLYQAAFAGEEDEGPPQIVTVTNAQGDSHHLNSEALLAELTGLFGRTPQLFRMKRGCFDSMPVSLISRSTVAGIGEQVEMELDARRFRPNLLIDILPGLAEREEDWMDGLLVFGEREDSPRLRLNRPNKRCVMITLDPETGAAAPVILKYVARSRDECAGVYSSVEKPGALIAGESIFLI
ncbi:MAG: MOSC domain-containing protein [Chloroflexi bacterium]|nr:MOSC domain-containing protein [Chloroflexota bacterium]